MPKLEPRPTKAVLDEKGREVLDPVPLAPPVGYRREVSQSERIRQMIRSEHMRMAAEIQGMESFEEADDFDVEDDPIDPNTPYEEVFDPIDAEVRRQLRDDEFRASVQSRFNENRPAEEVLKDGNNVDKGRSEPAEDRDPLPDRDDKSVVGKDKAPGVSGSLRKGS